MDRIYMDYAAAAPLHPEVKKVMDAAEAFWANPSSLHEEGRQARAVVDKARFEIAKFIGAETDEIIFTSGATESNILALRGVVEYASSRGARPHIIINRLEHASVIEPVKQLEADGVEVTWLEVDRMGRVNREQLEASVKANTVFVSVIYANNETGVVNDIAELAKAAKAKNPNLVFHTDAAQAVGWLELNVSLSGIDMLSVSSYKLGGPKGVGALYVRSGIKMMPIFPGTQEWGKRAGTESPVLIAGMAKAMQLSALWPKDVVRRLRDYLISEISQIEDVLVNTEAGKSVPHIAHFSFAGIDSQILTIALDRAGLAASPGSACSSGAVETSHVVEALGIDLKKYPGSLRLSLGVDTTEEQVRSAVEIIKKAVNELRAHKPQ